MPASKQLKNCGVENGQSSSQEAVGSHEERSDVSERHNNSTMPISDTEDDIDPGALLQILHSASDSIVDGMGKNENSDLKHCPSANLPGKLDDIEKAVMYHHRALGLTPDFHPDLPDRHTSLGVSYTDLYRRTDEVADLFKAIEYNTRTDIPVWECHTLTDIDA
ncbi:hypothetical protein AG1IA_09808 [Rhizoctonia solani AG-1 IA]|uniref:Uncharacterized protein n=1 Tax=Thanatephorus cucumeris (strain AG1-IA) TaxID=983506 RepID=L8WHG0_THACA|nr:hypothetical protein AG1IA_09808 [Rhizoctonia solani AG-1 IA]